MMSSACGTQARCSYCASSATWSYSLNTFFTSEQDLDAVELAFGVHEVDFLVGDAQAGWRAAQAMLDERAPDALALGPEFDQRQRGSDQQFRLIFFQDENIAHLVHGARQGQA